MNIKKVKFEEDYYIKKESNKTQITLHHTVGGGKTENIANYWKTLKNKKTGLPQRVCTSYVIEKDGTIGELFDSIYGGGHIGDCADEFKVFNLPPITLSMLAVGIELISMGGLIERNKKLYDDYGNVFTGPTIKLDTKFRGYFYFEKYTDAQIKATGELMQFLSHKHNIPLTYNESMWDISKDALSGKPGLFSHVSYRLDKSDIYSDPDLINLLKSL